MNKIFKTKNNSKGQSVVTSELAKSKNLIAILLMASPLAFATTNYQFINNVETTIVNEKKFNCKS